MRRARRVWRCGCSSEGAGTICAEVLAALPEWFGFPDSVADYVAAADTQPDRRGNSRRARLRDPDAAGPQPLRGGDRRHGRAARAAPCRHRAGHARGRRVLAGRAGHRVPAGEDAQPALIPTRGMPPPGPSTSAAASGRWRRCPSCGDADQPALQMIKTVPPRTIRPVTAPGGAGDRSRLPPGAPVQGPEQPQRPHRAACQVHEGGRALVRLARPPASTGPRTATCSRSAAGPGALWVNVVAPLLPRLRLTLTDLSDGMVAAATAAVAPLAGDRARRGPHQRRPGPALRRRRVRRRRGEPHALPRPRSAPGRRAVRPRASAPAAC